MNEAMITLFIKRMQFHQSLVRKYLLLMEGYLNLSKSLLLDVAEQHDQSKFEEPERTGYIWITWMYYCKSQNISFQYPIHVKESVFSAWNHHVINNRHHPEFHENPNLMLNLDMVEMVCDWMAVSHENKTNCMNWALENLDKKWSFSKSTKEIIFSTIKELEKRIKVSRKSL